MGEESRYRIQVVAERTGVSAATLRAWERRYGVPTPDRASSAYRLYSESDIDLIDEILKMREAGVSMVDAAARVRGRMTERAGEALTENLESDDPFATVRDRIIDAVRSSDPKGLDRLLSSVAYTGRASLIFDRVLGPVMRELGEMWHRGEISVGEEHMASYLLEGRARNMLAMLEFAEDASPVVLACVDTEEHSFPIFGLAFRLARWGYRPVMLGARTPPGALRSTIENLQPAWIGLSMTINVPPHRLREMVENYVGVCSPVPVIFGGRASNKARKVIERGGGFVAESASEDAIRAVVERVSRGR